jgi:hypothetical protein
VLIAVKRSGYQFGYSESGWIPKVLQQAFQCYQVCNAKVGRIICAGGHSQGFTIHSSFLRSDCDVVYTSPLERKVLSSNGSCINSISPLRNSIPT